MAGTMLPVEFAGKAVLIIRREQFAVFERRILTDFADETVELMRSDQADAVAHLAEPALKARVEFALARAWGMGMRTDAALQDFTALMLVFGPRFDRHPAVKKLLASEAIHPDDRIDALYQELPRRVWDELSILACDDGWP